MKEIIVKIVRESATQYKIDSPKHVLRYWNECIATKDDFDPEKEHLVCIILNSKLAAKAHHIVSVGLNNQTLVHAREVFRTAIAVSAAQIILIHNHPSNDVTPSADDIRSTREIHEGGKLLGIALLDHVIVASNGSAQLSLKERGLLC